jgi:hypothetical protein
MTKMPWTKEQKREYMRNWRRTHKEEFRAYQREYYQRPEVQQRQKEHMREWVKNHRERARELCRKSYHRHIEERKQYHQRPEVQQRERVRNKKRRVYDNEYHRKYRRTLEGKQVSHRHFHKRRGLGWIELTPYFDGAEGHHLDRTFVANIPYELHTSIYHNGWTGKGMNEINAKVLDWLGIKPLTLAEIKQLPQIDPNGYETPDVVGYALSL